MLSKKHLSSVLMLCMLVVPGRHAVSQVTVAHEEVVSSSPEPTRFPFKIPKGKMQYNKDARTWYVVDHDNKALYIRLVITDATQCKKIMLYGMELWIDPKGKKNKTTGIRYPLPAGNSGTIARDNKQFRGRPAGEEPDTNKEIANALLKSREMQLEGFAKELNGIQDNNHPSGLQVSLHLSSDSLIYDVTIPYKVFITPVGPGSTVRIGIIEKGMQRSSDMGGFMPGGDMGPPPGGMMRGEGMEMMQMEGDDVIWYKYKLWVQ